MISSPIDPDVTVAVNHANHLWRSGPERTG